MKTLRILAVAALATAGTAVGAGVAAAHVTVDPATAAPGSYSVLTFRVPTESDTASTVGLTIHLPTDHPLASVRYQPVAGWTAKAETTVLDEPVTEGRVEITEPVTTVTFTAEDGNGIGPGEFGQFQLSVGPLPDVASLSFPAEQVYDDGSVVAWDDPTPANGEEPDHPAPTLTLDAAAHEGAGHQHSGAAGDSQATVSAAPAPDGADSTARVVAVVAVVVAALALLLAAVGWRRAATAGSGGSRGNDSAGDAEHGGHR